MRTTTISRSQLVRLRLCSQALVRRCGSSLDSPERVVDRLFALQGQDLPGVLWSLGRRSGATRAQVKGAFDAGALVRSWPFRGTLHVLAAADIGWVLELTARRTLASAAKRHRDLGLDDGTVEKARTLAVDSMHGGRAMGRRQLLQAFEHHGVSTEGQRGAHLLGALCLTGTCVLGPFTGEEQQFVLLDEWVPAPRELARDEALVEIVVRYLAGRGPATEADLAWWTKLPLRDIRQGIDGAGDQVATVECAGTTYLVHEPTLAEVSSSRPCPALLLPGFDELLLGYRDRSASLAAQHAPLTVPGNNGMFKATVVSRGRVVGLWSRRSTTKKTMVTATPFDAPFAPAVEAALPREASAYGRYLQHPTELTIAS